MEEPEGAAGVAVTDSESARIEHLKLIQAVIARMARNSFAIKAAASTITAALVAVTAGSGTPLAAIGGIPLIMLWLLDGYYLRQERLFRELFDFVSTGQPPEPGSEAYFSMKTEGLHSKAGSLQRILVRGTLLAFYVPLLLILALSAILVSLT